VNGLMIGQCPGLELVPCEWADDPCEWADGWTSVLVWNWCPGNG